MISLIVAMAQNRTIGAHGKLPWHLPGDLQRFKQLTMGQSLLLGRKTYQSIGRPLAGRQMIVLSHNADFRAGGCLVVSSLQEGLDAVTNEQLFICGGEEIYRQALPLAEKIYLTELLQEVAGDSHFPLLPADQYQLVHSEKLVDAGQACRFSILQR